MAVTIAELCVEHGISSEQLAERCGLELTRANAIILGRWTPKPEERQKLAEQFGVSIEEIRWGHTTPIQHLWGQGPA